MSDNIYDRIHRSLTWKKIIAFNLLLFLVTVVPLSLRLAQQDTENRSGAAGEVPTPSVTPPPSYPQDAPRIDRVTEFFGKKGDTVVVLGNNFGDYQWGSHLFVGDVETTKENVVRWSNAVIEVQIPEGARTGKVWIVVNDRESQWDGSLLLYDVNRSAQVGIRKDTATQATVWIAKAAGIVGGMVEVGHLGEPLVVTADGGSINGQSQTADSLGKKTRVEFNLTSPATSANTNLLTISHPGIGTIELLRIELYDTAGRLVSVFADPFNVKVN